MIVRYKIFTSTSVFAFQFHLKFHTFDHETRRSVYVTIHQKKIISDKSIFKGITNYFCFEKEHIDFKIKEKDINARYGVFGIDKATSTYIPRKANTIYSIYVKRKDYDTALLLLHSYINN